MRQSNMTPGGAVVVVTVSTWSLTPSERSALTMADEGRRPVVSASWRRS